MRLFQPDLWDRLFDPHYVPPAEEGEDVDAFFPASDEEFDAIMAEIEAEEAEARRAAGLTAPVAPPPTSPSPAAPSAGPVWPPPEWLPDADDA